MSDYVETDIDKRIARLSQKLKREYEQAYVEMKHKADAYFANFKAEDEIMAKRVANGELTQHEYTDWRKRKMLNNSRYKAMVDKLAQDLTRTDELAIKSINGTLPKTYTTAANYEAMNIERVTGNPFTVYNEEAVARLAKQGKLYLPPKLDVPKAERWNVQRIHSAIMQGILQGDSTWNMAKRLMQVVAMNTSQAVRTARTAHTAACNEGRMDSYRRAEKMGTSIQRQWIATHDERTRDAHLELDHQIRPLGEPFENSLGKIRFPADPQADPANVYNCRCALRGVIAGHEYKGGSGRDYSKYMEGKLYGVGNGI